MFFFLQSCSFSLHKMRDWSRVDYCDVFISCLDSFWRHPFTAEDPLVSKRWNATFLQICSDKETKSSISRMAWGWVHFLIFLFLGELFLWCQCKRPRETEPPVGRINSSHSQSSPFSLGENLSRSDAEDLHYACAEVFCCTAQPYVVSLSKM